MSCSSVSCLSRIYWFDCCFAIAASLVFAGACLLPLLLLLLLLVCLSADLAFFGCCRLACLTLMAKKWLSTSCTLLSQTKGDLLGCCFVSLWTDRSGFSFLNTIA
ncbi:hypothetical protein GE21DRAFT_1044773 [Neurospora crassa]|nr:hypothetical protein GE21DRAFT_1044773 [Neurospora crassa]